MSVYMVVSRNEHHGSRLLPSVVDDCSYNQAGRRIV